MRFRSISPRALLSLLVAVVFAIAAEPGAMAMPQPHKMAMPTMEMAAMTACGMQADAGCDHMKPQKSEQSPCKSMAVCMGLLSCFGIAAIAADHPFVADAPARLSLLRAYQPGFGLTVPPDNPPPIA